ncbi:MAG: hypothetical protein II937_05805 [Bacteroidales bacterium]|nr:hypothetical protein [Bacteroidales bacterium]
MDFNSLGQGSPFYVLNKTEKPILRIGTVKSKTTPQPKYQQGTNAFNTTNLQQVINITATIDGKDEIFSDIPFNVEVAKIGENLIFSGSQTAMSAVVENLIQTSKKALEQVNYHKTMIDEGDRILEFLNPKYADEKRQAKTISELEKKQAETDKKLDKISTDNAQILAMLKKLTGETKPQKN